MTYTPHVWSRHDKLDSTALNSLEQAVGAFSGTADEATAAAANADAAAANAASSADSAAASAALVGAPAGTAIDAHLGGDSTTVVLDVSALKVATYIDVTTEGCVLDGTTDNATAFQAAASKAKTLGRALYIPAGDLWWTGDVQVFTDVRCEGNLIFKQAVVNTLTVTRTATSSTIAGTALGGLTAGSQIITGTGGIRGSIELISSEELIKRDGSGGASYTKRESSQIAADGTITPALANTYATPASLTATLYPYESPITLTGLRCKVTGTGTFPHDHLVQVSRDNVTLDGFSAQNDTAMTPINAIRVQSCTGITFNSPRINGFDNSGAGYGIACYNSALATFNDPGITRCRHSVSGTYNKNIQINGGSLYMLDQHWCNSLTVDRATITVGAGMSLVQVAGSNVTLRDCTLNGGRNIVGIREDTPELAGAITLERCTWVPSTDATIWAVGYTSNSNSTSFLWGRAMQSPSRVTITDLVVDRSSISSTLTLASVLNVTSHNFARTHWADVRVTRLRRINTDMLALFYELNSTYISGAPGMATFTECDLTRQAAGDNIQVTNATDTAGVGYSLRLIDCTGAWLKLPEIGMTDVLIRGGTLGRLFRSAASAAPAFGTFKIQSCEMPSCTFNGGFLLDLVNTTWSGTSTSSNIAIDARVKSITGGILRRVGATGAPTGTDGYKNSSFYS